MNTRISKALICLITVLAPAPLPAEESAFSGVYETLKNSGGSLPGRIPEPAAAAASKPLPPSDAVEAREWLIMVFINGRNNLASAAIRDVNEMEMVGSTDKVAVTVELGLLKDRGTSSRFLVLRDGVNPVTNLPSGDFQEKNIISRGIKVPNSDMGSWSHFVDFAKWSIRKYPAKKTMVVLWNHGSGRAEIGGPDNSGAELGIAYDDLTRNFIRNKQIGMALAEIRRATGKKVDIYASDACLMQMASVVYEIKDHADYILGSEELVPGSGFPYNDFLTPLTGWPQITAEEFSRLMVGRYSQFYETHKAKLLGSGNKGTTISAIKTSELPGFTLRLDAWVAAAKRKSNAALLGRALEKTLTFEYGEDTLDSSYNVRSKDLYDFISMVNAEAAAPPELKARGRELQTFMKRNLIIANRTTGPNPMYTRARGLAIYFPKMIYDSSYDETIFANATLWDEFLKFLLEQQL